jgi:MFS family permease
MSWLFAVNVFAPLYITEAVHESATIAGFLLGASGLGSFFLGFLLPTLSDRWGRKPILLLMAAMSAVVPLAFLVPVLYVYPAALAFIVFVANSGQGIASVVLVLVPTESVPAQFRATSIGLATLAGEVMGATTAPILAGTLAQRHGLAVTMWLAATGSGLLFLVALFLQETYGCGVLLRREICPARFTANLRFCWRTSALTFAATFDRSSVIPLFVIRMGLA